MNGTPVDTGSGGEQTRPDGSSQRSLVFGPYRLLQRVGEGGMGEVWVAEQLHPVRRRVALKVIKRGMDTAQVVARFEAERQALALMDHPAIARVFDAGATPQGRPYFVMEFVQGEPITAYCTRHKLTVAERLQLVIQVCEGGAARPSEGHHPPRSEALERARHVAGRPPVPKIIDFGVAKATTHTLTDTPLHTEVGALVGTPEYMSPEQAEMSGLDVDTRTDIYALGVILYELLTGVLPFEPSLLRAKGLDEVRRTIREVDPPRPSTRVSTLSGASGPGAWHPPAASSQLRGDLDWITMKALEKDRTRRYETANGLAMDLRRHLAGEPVSAAPAGTTYRVRKFARRHRVGVATAAAIVTPADGSRRVHDRPGPAGRARARPRQRASGARGSGGCRSKAGLRVPRGPVHSVGSRRGAWQYDHRARGPRQRSARHHTEPP